MINRLRELNPWWADPTAIDRDRHLLAASRAPFHWDPRVFAPSDLETPSVYTLRGPRQAGKTTLLKRLIHQSLAAGWPPQRILYYTFDLERDMEAAVRLVRTAREIFPGPGPWRIFLDEVSSLPDWQKAVKYLRDQTQAAEDTFILTGSSAHDIRIGAERLPGRRGPGERLDRILLPMSFTEFCTTRGLPAPPVRLAPDAFLAPAHDSAIHQGLLLQSEIETCFQLYLSSGGFPAAVADTMRNGDIQAATLRTLWDIVAGDVERWNRDHLVALKLLERTGRSLTAPMSWRGLAEEMGVAPATAEEYARLMAESFVLMILHFWDPARRGGAPRKQKKVYFVDPALSRLPALLLGGPAGLTAATVENAVAMGLFRATEPSPVEAFATPQRLFYWRSTSGREVDFLVRSGDSLLPVEVKYQATVSGHDLEAIRRGFGRGLLLSRDRLDLSGPIRILPAALFLWMLTPAAD